MDRDRDSILIVDDTPANLDVLYTLLNGEGYHVRVASSGEHALQSVQAALPDLILLDIRMPGIDGYEVCRRLKDDSNCRHIPIIFISAARELEDKITAFSVGGVDYVTKPFQKEEVLARIKTHLHLKKLNERLEEEIRTRTSELRKEMSERRETSERLRRLSDNLPRGMVYQLDTGRDGATRKFTYISAGVESLYGVTAEEALNDANLLYRQVFPEDLSLLKEAEAEAINGMKTFKVEARFCRPDGSQWWSLLVASPHLGSHGNVVWDGLQLDITEQKLLEQQFLQAQKMESIGRLAGGVAHDFSNMLSIILGAAELAKTETAAGKPLGQYLDAIMDAAERSAQITRQLLAFSRKEIIAPKPVDLNKSLRDAQKNLGRLIGEHIEILFHPGADLWPVMLEPSQLDQIVINLAINGRDAMVDGGQLIIETENIPQKICETLHLDNSPGDYVRLRISDTGSGMDEFTRQHIFEPFFTTKEVGKGTGLGLATVYGIVTQNNGSIAVSSKPGKGTVFELYFHRMSEDAIKEKHQPEETDSGSGTIVVVEDEKLLLDMTTEMLQSVGYKVTGCNDPESAIALFTSQDVEADLLLTDVVMPGMNGKEMAKRIKAVRPGIKVMFMSGYTGDIIANYGLMDDSIWFIRKPFKLRDLANKIKEVLASQSS